MLDWGSGGGGKKLATLVVFFLKVLILSIHSSMNHLILSIEIIIPLHRDH